MSNALVGATPPPFSMYQAPAEPTKHNLLIIGEAPGEEEEKTGIPFVGSSGELLNELLLLSGFRREQFHVTNVFTQRPPNNEFQKNWTVTKTDLRKMGYSDGGRLPPINKRYLLPQYESELARLSLEVRQIKPDLIICLGGTALWALTGDARITMNRGTFFETGFGCPAIATFHPAMILRQWDQRPFVWADLVKARRFLNGTLPEPISRRLWIDPTFEEIELVYNKFIPRMDVMGVDIETDPRIDQITTISFGFPDECICIPFYDKHTLAEKCNYWPTAEEEARAWMWVRRFSELPCPKAGQNFLYDMQYLLDPLDIRVRNVQDDTAIAQHSLQPELKKDLGTLASLYINEPAWKFMRESSKDDNKADD